MSGPPARPVSGIEEAIGSVTATGHAFNAGIPVSEEVSRWLFVWPTFAGAIVAVRDRARLGIDPVGTCRDGLQNLRVTDAIAQAAKTGQVVKTA
jgi:hypothetical protein